MKLQNNAIVHKFGGSCLSDTQSFSKTLNIIREFKDTPSIAVLSAFKGVTDKIIGIMNFALDDKEKAEDLCDKLRKFHINMANQMIPEAHSSEIAINFVNDAFSTIKENISEIFQGGLPPSLRDVMLSFGERLSSFLFTQYLLSQGIDAQFFSGDSLITTSPDFGNSMPRMKKTSIKILENLIPALEKGNTCIVTGFYGETESGQITTLGRGGSDFTATIIANVLSGFFGTKVIFWKDVDGLLTANPNIEPDAVLIENISYDEAKELAYFGSKVLHPICLRMVMEKDVPAEIRNFNKDLNAPYTTISKYKEKTDKIVKSIACIEACQMITVQGAAMVSLPGIAAKLFELMANHHINILFISQASSENNITFLVNQDAGEEAVHILETSKFFGKRWFEISQEDVSLIAVVGHGMTHQWGISGKIFTALGDAKVNVRAIAQGSSELNISIIITPGDLETAIKAIHCKFIE